MAEILHQLRLVVCPIIVRLYTSQVGFLAGFQPSTVSPLNLPTDLSFTKKDSTTAPSNQHITWKIDVLKTIVFFFGISSFQVLLLLVPRNLLVQYPIASLCLTFLYELRFAMASRKIQHTTSMLTNLGCFPSFPSRKWPTLGTQKPTLGTQNQPSEPPVYEGNPFISWVPGVSVPHVCFAICKTVHLSLPTLSTGNGKVSTAHNGTPITGSEIVPTLKKQTGIGYGYLKLQKSGHDLYEGAWENSTENIYIVSFIIYILFVEIQKY